MLILTRPMVRQLVGTAAGRNALRQYLCTGGVENPAEVVETILDFIDHVDRASREMIKEHRRLTR